MADNALEKALHILADHFAGDDANARNRETGAKLKAALKPAPTPKAKAAEPSTTDDEGK